MPRAKGSGFRCSLSSVCSAHRMCPRCRSAGPLWTGLTARALHSAWRGSVLFPDHGMLPSMYADLVLFTERVFGLQRCFWSACAFCCERNMVFQHLQAVSSHALGSLLFLPLSTPWAGLVPGTPRVWLLPQPLGFSGRAVLMDSESTRLLCPCNPPLARRLFCFAEQLNPIGNKQSRAHRTELRLCAPCRGAERPHTAVAQLGGAAARFLPAFGSCWKAYCSAEHCFGLKKQIKGTKVFSDPRRASQGSGAGRICAFCFEPR